MVNPPEIIERRRHPHHGTSEVLELVRQIHDNQLGLDKKLTQHMMEEPIRLGEEIAKLYTNCFPNGDAQGHKKAHDAWIQQAEESRDFWRTMRKELGKWGLIGFLGWAVWALWSAFLQGPHK